MNDEQDEPPGPRATPGAAEERPGPRGVATRVRAVAVAAPEITDKEIRAFRPALAFLAPALLVLLVILVYPIAFTVWRSFYGAGANLRFVGIDNYLEMFTDPRSLTAVKNNAYWVVVAPAMVTALGLVFAVLIDRVRLKTVFKTVLFMPMAISFLAVGIIFRLAYDHNPEIGLANALLQGAVHVFRPPGPYPGATPSLPEQLTATSAGGFATSTEVAPGETATLGLVGIRPDLLPEAPAAAAIPPPTSQNEVAGTIWFDFSPHGTRGQVDPGEPGLPDVRVEAVQAGRTAASAVTAEDGTFRLHGLDPGGTYILRLPPRTFRPPFGGVGWLGPDLFLGAAIVTWSIMAAFVWMWAGFAMVVISAGLAAIPREVLEAARVDGANEWQVFRRVTVPLLAPVLLVVLVTLMINVLKIFDLVLITAPGSTEDDATVLALRMWRVSFGGGNDQGLGSAITVFLFLLVIPAMLFNIRRFRREG